MVFTNVYLFAFALMLPLSTACENEDRYLCRMCGRSAGDGGTVYNIASPFALSQRNETWQCGEGNIASQNVVVQKLENPASLQFDVVTVKQSSCKGVGKWSSDFTWYPGYSWKACVCRQCGRHLGWYLKLSPALKQYNKLSSCRAFEPDIHVEKSLPEKPSSAGFYALISENLLTETFAQSLAFTPKLFRQ